MAPGDQAIKLISESKSSTATNSFRPYNDELVRLIVLETRQLQTHISHLLESAGGPERAEADRGLAAQLVTHHLAAQRNKRCLLAYHSHRLERLRSAFWDAGASLPHLLADDSNAAVTPVAGTDGAQGSNSLRACLSTAELAWLRDYASLVTAYKGEFLDVLDVSAGGMAAPPRELMVSVLVRRDARDVQTEAGSLNLRKGERMRVRRSDVELLITLGWMEVVDD